MISNKLAAFLAQPLQCQEQRDFVFAIRIRMLSQVTIDELKKSMTGPMPPKIIDVREPDEFSRGHIKNAESIPLPTLASEIKRKYPNKSQSLVLYDDLGVRSHHAARLLRAMGYRSVKEVLGGFSSLRAS